LSDAAANNGSSRSALALISLATELHFGMIVPYCKGNAERLACTISHDPARHRPARAVSVRSRLTKTVTSDFADVGGKLYLLPASSETEMRSFDLSARNHTDFREYRKFSADSTIVFGGRE